MSEVNEVEDDNDNDGCCCWHYRTIRHIDSRFAGWGVASADPEDDVYVTAHEAFYTGEEYDAFTFSHSVAQSKQEAEWILQAYNFPPIAEVDDADLSNDEYGFPTYSKFVWLDKRLKKSEVKEADNNVINTTKGVIK